MSDKAYVIYESVVSSWMRDVGTISLMVGGVWFNEKFVGGSVFLNAILLVLFVLFLVARVARLKDKAATSREQALAMVDRVFPKPPEAE